MSKDLFKLGVLSYFIHGLISIGSSTRDFGSQAR